MGLAGLRVVETEEQTSDVSAPSRRGTLFGRSVVFVVDIVMGRGDGRVGRR